MKTLKEKKDYPPPSTSPQRKLHKMLRNCFRNPNRRVSLPPLADKRSVSQSSGMAPATNYVPTHKTILSSSVFYINWLYILVYILISILGFHYRLVCLPRLVNPDPSRRRMRRKNTESINIPGGRARDRRQCRERIGPRFVVSFDSIRETSRGPNLSRGTFIII